VTLCAFHFAAVFHFRPAASSSRLRSAEQSVTFAQEPRRDAMAQSSFVVSRLRFSSDTSPHPAADPKSGVSVVIPAKTGIQRVEPAETRPVL
jgi:hypothetical protein